MKVTATGRTGRLIVRFHPGERLFRRGPGSREGKRIQEPTYCRTI